MNEELKQMCDALPLDEKVKLRNYLSRQITLVECRSKTPLRGEILLSDVADVLGESTIPSSCRDSKYVWARAMVAYQMSLEGYTCTEIGRQLLRHHSDIIHLRRRMQDALKLPFAYRDVVEIWNKFQNRIQQ